ncbi:MAG: hypothetical protein R3C15_22530 [Thermoleophilia bacterium]
MRRTILTSAIAALALAATAGTAAAGTTTTYEHTWSLKKGKQVRTYTAEDATRPAFRVELTVPHGRRVFLRIRNSDYSFHTTLIDTSTYACERAGANDVCSAQFESLPSDTYYLRVSKRSGTGAARVTLRVAY